MYKKYIAGGSFFLILVVCLLLKGLQDIKFVLFNPVSSTMAEEIWEEKTRVERFDFGLLMCNDIQVAVDYIEKTFYIPLDMETDEWETLEFRSGKSEYQILFQEDFTQYDKKELIAEGKIIEFLVYNESEFSTYYIIFTGLPVMDISTMEGIAHQKEISGNAVFYDTNFTSNGIQTSAYNGHVRGNTSTLYPKKGYKINLTKQTEEGVIENNKLSLFGMRKDDDWILYAMYNDESKLRAKLSIDLWNEMGAKEVRTNSTYNTNLTYIELLVDESYYGLYALMEPIDAKQLNLQEEDYLYKREHPYELSAAVFEQAKNPEEQVLGFEIKEGILDEDAWQPMALFSEVLMSSDEEFADKIADIADVENAMQLWLYLQVIAGYDQRGKNVFYVAEKEGDSYRFTFAPWDMDLTWGNTSDSESQPYYTTYREDTLDDRFSWETGDRLVQLNVNGAAEKMLNLYTQLRQTILSDEAMEERIMELDHTLRDSGAYEREKMRWPETAYAEDCSTVLNYAQKRLAYLDKALHDLNTY